MLKRLAVRGFKSLQKVEVSFPCMAVLFGPNAAGKSNLLDAIQALSRIGALRTLADALAEPIRGYPIEAFSFPPEGLAGLLGAEAARFSLEADLTRDRDAFRYRVEVEIAPGSGKLAVSDEYLSELGKDGQPKGTPAIEKGDRALFVGRKTEAGRRREEPLGLNFTILSDPRLNAPEHADVANVGGRLRNTHRDARV